MKMSQALNALLFKHLCSTAMKTMLRAKFPSNTGESFSKMYMIVASSMRNNNDVAGSNLETTT
jgi:hypothetical protein